MRCGAPAGPSDGLARRGSGSECGDGGGGGEGAGGGEGGERERQFGLQGAAQQPAGVAGVVVFEGGAAQGGQSRAPVDGAERDEGDKERGFDQDGASVGGVE